MNNLRMEMKRNLEALLETELRSIADITLDFVMSDGTKITQYVIFDFSQYLIPISNITLDKGSIVF